MERRRGVASQAGSGCRNDIQMLQSNSWTSYTAYRIALRSSDVAAKNVQPGDKGMMVFLTIQTCFNFPTYIIHVSPAAVQAYTYKYDTRCILS